MKTTNAVWLILLIFSPLGAYSAQEPHASTDVELKSLPYYCTIKRQLENGVSGAREAGYAALGEQFGNVHHFCNGLNFINRYYRSQFGPNAKSNLASAINEFTYMADHMVPKSTLAGEIFLNRGVAFSLAKRDMEALKDFRQAISLNPKLPKAYMSLADFLNEKKQRVEALKIVTQGLQNIPDNSALKRRYDELGGQQPYPAPLSTVEESAASLEPAPGTAANTGADTTEPKAPNVEPAYRVPDHEPGKAATTTPKSKPYCRFCPEDE